VLSIAAEGVGGSPSFLTVPDRRLGEYGVKAGDRCVVQPGRIRLGWRSINFQNAALWKRSISKNYRCNAIKKENIAAFKAVLDRKAPPQSAWRYINSGSESRFTGGGPRRAGAAEYTGLAAIRKLRENPLEARNLIGLGQGLTPAGDDMLVGFMAMANHLSGNGTFIRELHSAVSGSLHKTVDLSAQTLANTLNCDYHEYIENCIRDLCENEKESVYISAASLLSIGATSGSDIACGMYFAMCDYDML
jgi:hypothetical protein